MGEFKAVTQLSPDSKGRITLGKFARGVSSFQVNVNTAGQILLVPYVEIPAREQWLFKNRQAASSVKRGLRQSAEGKTRSLGSFVKYAKDDE